MRYKNITSGIVPVLGRGQVNTNQTIDLSEEEVQNPEIAVYIGKYLVPAKGVADVEVKVSSEKDASIKAPKDKTAEELEAEKKKEEGEQTVGVEQAQKTADGSVVQAVSEIKKSQVEEELTKIRAILSPKKKAEHIQSIDSLVLLRALEVELVKKTKAIVQARIKELSK